MVRNGLRPVHSGRRLYRSWLFHATRFPHCFAITARRPCWLGWIPPTMGVKGSWISLHPSTGTPLATCGICSCIPIRRHGAIPTQVSNLARCWNSPNARGPCADTRMQFAPNRLAHSCSPTGKSDSYCWPAAKARVSGSASPRGSLLFRLDQPITPRHFLAKTPHSLFSWPASAPQAATMEIRRLWPSCSRTIPAWPVPMRRL